MMLLRKVDRKNLPPLYAQDGKGDEAMVWVKFFSIVSSHIMYATEFDGQDRFFGLTAGAGIYSELGYFSLSEMESIKGMGGMPGIERDMYWSPRTLGEVRAEIARNGGI